MTSDQFVTNVITKPQQMLDQPPEEYTEYSRELLTELYESIRDEPLMCAVFPAMVPAPGGIIDGMVSMDYYQLVSPLLPFSVLSFSQSLE